MGASTLTRILLHVALLGFAAFAETPDEEAEGPEEQLRTEFLDAKRTCDLMRQEARSRHWDRLRRHWRALRKRALESQEAGPSGVQSERHPSWGWQDDDRKDVGPAVDAEQARATWGWADAGSLAERSPVMRRQRGRGGARGYSVSAHGGLEELGLGAPEPPAPRGGRLVRWRGVEVPEERLPPYVFRSLGPDARGSLAEGTYMLEQPETCPGISESISDIHVFSAGVRSRRRAHRYIHNCTIAILVPTLGSDDTKATLLELFKSVSHTASGKCKIGVFLAFDKDDDWFSDSSNRNVINDEFDSSGLGTTSDLYWIQNNGARTYVNAINEAASKALKHNFKYLFQLGDDVTITTKDWDLQLSAELEKMGNIGAVGPVETVGRSAYRKDFLQQAFVPKEHVCMFGYFFPPSFRNVFSDDWLTSLYKWLGHFKQVDSVEVTNVKDNRYEIDQGAAYSWQSAAETSFCHVLAKLRCAQKHPDVRLCNS